MNDCLNRKLLMAMVDSEHGLTLLAPCRRMLAIFSAVVAGIAGV